MTISEVFAGARERDGMRTTISLALLTFCAWLLCQSSSAYATVLSQSDAQRAIELSKNVGQLGGDVRSAATAGIPNIPDNTTSFLCLNDMVYQLDDLGRAAVDIGSLVLISAKMQLAADEATVNTLLANRIKIYRKVTDPLRQRINHDASACRNDYFVNEKAQEALRLLSEFESILDSLQSKLGGAG